MDRLRFYKESRSISFSGNDIDINDIAMSVYEVVDDGHGEYIMRSIYKEYDELQMKGLVPKFLYMSKKAYENLMCYCYFDAMGLIQDVFMDMDIIVDGSDLTYNFKILCDVKAEFLHREY